METWLGAGVWAARLSALAILAGAIVFSIANQDDADAQEHEKEALARLRNDFLVTADGILVFKCDTRAIEVREKLREAGKRACRPDVRCVLFCFGGDASADSWEDVLALDVWLRPELLLGHTGRHYYYFEDGAKAFVALPCLYMYRSGASLGLPASEKWPSAIEALRAELTLILREAETSGDAQTVSRAREFLERCKDDKTAAAFLTLRYDLRGAMQDGSQGTNPQADTVNLDAAGIATRFSPWPLGARQHSADDALRQLRRDLPLKNASALTTRLVTSVVVSALIFVIASFALLAPAYLPRIALTDQSMLRVFAIGTAIMLGPTVALLAPLVAKIHAEQFLRPFVVGFGGWWYYPALFSARLFVGVMGVCWITPTVYPDQSDPRLRRNLTIFVCMVASLGPAISAAAEAKLYIPSLFDPAIGDSSGFEQLLLQLIVSVTLTVMLSCVYLALPKSPQKPHGGRSSQFKFVALLVVTALSPVLSAPMTLSSSAMRLWRKLKQLVGRKRQAMAAMPRVLPEVLLPLASSTSALRGLEYVGLLLASGMAALFANALMSPASGGALVPAYCTALLVLIVPLGALAALAANPRPLRLSLGLIIVGSLVLTALPWGPVPIWHAVARFFGNAPPDGFSWRAFAAGLIAQATLLGGTYGMYRFTTDSEVIRALMLETRVPDESERKAWHRLRRAPLAFGMLMPACLFCVAMAVQLSIGMARVSDPDFLLALLFCAPIGFMGGWAMRLDRTEPLTKWYELFRGVPGGAAMRGRIASALPGLATRFPRWLEADEPDRFE